MSAQPISPYQIRRGELQAEQRSGSWQLFPNRARACRWSRARRGPTGTTTPGLFHHRRIQVRALRMQTLWTLLFYLVTHTKKINEISVRALRGERGGLQGFIPAPLLVSHPPLQKHKNRCSFVWPKLSGRLRITRRIQSFVLHLLTLSYSFFLIDYSLPFLYTFPGSHSDT